MGDRSVPAHEPTDGSGNAPRLWLSISVWLAAVALDTWAVVAAVGERNTPYYCGRSAPLSALLALAVSVVGLRRAYRHWGGPRVIFIIGVLVAVGAVVLMAELNRPNGGCFD